MSNLITQPCFDFFHKLNFRQSVSNSRIISIAKSDNLELPFLKVCPNDESGSGKERIKNE